MEDQPEEQKHEEEVEEEKKQPVQSTKSKSKKLIDLPENPGNLEEYITILKDFQKDCEKNERYIEAGNAETRIKEVKKEIEKQKKLNFKTQLSEEKSKILMKHQEEFTEFNMKWDNKMKEYEEEAKKLEEVLINKHLEAYQKLEQELEESIPKKPKDSAELLNLRKREENLVKQKLYNQAHNVKEDRLVLEEKEIKKWEKDRKSKIALQMNTLKKKQDAEFKALQKKIDAGQEEQRKMRLLDLEKYIQKCENTKNEMEIQHATGLIKFDKALKTNGGSVHASQVNNEQN